MVNKRQLEDDSAKPVNAGEATTNTTASLNLDENAQFRNLNKRLDELADQVSRIAKPKEFRLADYIQIAMIVGGLLVALFTAWGLKDRIDDLVKGQEASETRIAGQITASEARVSSRLDKMDERFTKLDERTATLEGARGARQTGE